MNNKESEAYIKDLLRMYKEKKNHTENNSPQTENDHDSIEKRYPSPVLPPYISNYMNQSGNINNPGMEINNMSSNMNDENIPNPFHIQPPDNISYNAEIKKELVNSDSPLEQKNMTANNIPSTNQMNAASRDNSTNMPNPFHIQPPDNVSYNTEIKKELVNSDSPLEQKNEQKNMTANLQAFHENAKNSILHDNNKVKYNSNSENHENKTMGTGWLKVSVTSNNGSIPIPGAVVIISKTMPDKTSSIVNLSITDMNGATKIIPLPAPTREPNLSPDNLDTFSTYNIYVYYKDFFREASIDVPIFDGITSIQNFSLIPRPYKFDGSDGTIAYKNEEPIF